MPHMRARPLHRAIGVVLLLPFFGWAITGMVFFIKPGYSGAYESLSPKTYAMDKALSVMPDPNWREFRYFRTVLGDHLIVRTDSGWLQLNPPDLRRRAIPAEAELRLLLKDAFSADPQRYGNISTIAGNTATTDTGVKVSIDWNSMSLQQRGPDTDRIDLLYKIHYLEWTGVKIVDRVLGLTGLILVMVLTTLGAWLAFRKT
jgi:hypothetical protein